MPPAAHSKTSTIVPSVDWQDQALGPKQRDVLACKLQQVCFPAGLWLVGDDNDGRAGVGLHG
jgi:hypothetical protein